MLLCCDIDPDFYTSVISGKSYCNVLISNWYSSTAEPYLCEKFGYR